MNLHPNIKKLEELLNENPTWAVQITAPDFNGAAMKLDYLGKPQLWIHGYMIDGDLQNHVTQLAREKHLKNIDFQIKRSNGDNAYKAIPTSKLPEPKFSIKIEQETMQHDANNDTAAATTNDLKPSAVEQILQAVKGLKKQGLASPEELSVGLSVPQMIENERKISDLKHLNERKVWDLEHLKRENEDLKNKLAKKAKRLKQYEAEKPKIQDRIMAFVEANPEIAGKIFGVVDSLGSKVLSPAGLASPQTQPQPTEDPYAYMAEFIKFLQAQDSKKLVAQLHQVGIWSMHVDGFMQSFELFLEEFKAKNERVENNDPAFAKA